ncbi:hypothetical protein IIB79_08410, partial [candidate division KSB1 bacterium]|nr:hypothetical protein [candidate division KSB1 bacterium]
LRGELDIDKHFFDVLLVIGIPNDHVGVVGDSLVNYSIGSVKTDYNTG